MIRSISVGHTHKPNAHLQICTFMLHTDFIIFISERWQHLSLKKGGVKNTGETLTMY